MANVWTGGAQAVPQLNTITPGSVDIGDSFTVTINEKIITFVATAATVANVTAGLLAAIQASEEPEFTELTAADITTALTLTGPNTGAPFTQASSSVGGTLTTVVTTAASGPNHWNVAQNWSDIAAPASSDQVIVDGSTPDILYGLNQAAVDLDSLTVTAGYTGTIGLPVRNSTGYTEYRPTYLTIGTTTLTIGSGTGQGSGRIKIDTDVGATTTVNVLSTGASIDQGVEAFLWKGTGTNNVNITAGSVGIAVLPNDTAVIATLRIGGGTDANEANVRGGFATVTTLNQYGGTIEWANSITTINKVAGTLTIVGESAYTTINNDGGSLFYRSNGTITTLRNSNGATIDFTRDPRARTVTNSTVDAGSTLNDPNRTVTFTNPTLLQRCSLKDVTVDFGTHVTIAVAAGP